ncbi:serine hydrolase domain-containing protein [Bacillus sp. FJAT-49736]|uniref:serine hydrolase domain-containing protein n=1 Tax=Bacillus sp. FJAT-49736 TaxID=2833582 RepID=UPI001BC93840|nr:serine hydrolase domain-containing protein [Bacillus sp. FJAT-49736]MBS4175325.1 beta-lactamase family protein [Bacillus sp. FJAT-49736]
MENNPKHDKNHRRKGPFRIVIISSFVFILIIVVFYVSHRSNSGLNNFRDVTDVKYLITSGKRYNPPKKVISKGNSKNKKLDQYFKKIHFNGSVLIVKNGRIIINKGYGYADEAKKIPNNPETAYYIGSITKSFVATAFLQLQQEGKVNINEPLSNYLPNFPHAREITLYQLLTHTSGLPVRNEFGGKVSKEELIRDIGKTALHLKAKPGTRWGYSDANYSILGYIIEKASGVSLHQYIQEHIFNVAGMTQSGFGKNLQKEKYHSVGYRVRMGMIYRPELQDFSQVFGCGDIYSTPYDLYKFDHALQSGKLISKKSYRQMFTTHTIARYGYGWYINRKKWTVPPGNYSSHGVLPGWNGMNSFSKGTNTYVVLISNIQNSVKNYAPISRKIYTQLAKVHP